jgi:hypothetical protein
MYPFARPVSLTLGHNALARAGRDGSCEQGVMRNVAPLMARRPSFQEGTCMARNTASSVPNASSAELIAGRAYDIYQERGGADGFDLDDWLRAEREVNAMPTIASTRVLTDIKKRVSRKLAVR